MGVNCSILDFVLQFKGKLQGDCLQLGRQGLHIPAGHYESCRTVFHRYDPSGVYENIFSPTGYTENLFKYLGCNTVTSMDFSNYEGADIIADLNTPVPEEYHNKFDVIFDGGTLEHIFDTKTSFYNVKKMLKVGGIFLSSNGANNHLGHGFYQFSPDLYRSLFSEKTGYELLTMQIVAANLDPRPLDITVNQPHYFDIRTSSEQQYINVAVRKVADIDMMNPQQSAYIDDLWK